MEFCSPHWDTVADRQAVKWVCPKAAQTSIYWGANQGWCCHLLQSWCKQTESWGFKGVVPEIFHSKSSPVGWGESYRSGSYAIPYHTSQLFETLGFGLNSRQGREAKHVNLAKYVWEHLQCEEKHEVVDCVSSRLTVSYGLGRWTPTVLITIKRRRKILIPTWS